MKTNLKQILILLGIGLLHLTAYSQSFREQFGKAEAIFKNNELIVSTGEFQRSWSISKQGMVTTSIKSAGKEWVNVKNNTCDWGYHGLIDGDSEARLVSMKAEESNDQGFTSKHLLVMAEFEYPEVQTWVQFHIRVYPGAPGIFTQISLKGAGGKFINESAQPTNINFKLVNGKNKNNNQVHGHSPGYIARYAADSTMVEYLISGLNPAKNYRVGFTWYDIDGSGRKQGIHVTGIDGEHSVEAVNPQYLPEYKNAKKAEIEQFFDLPQMVFSDGSFRLIVDKHEGPNAVISEIWITENSNEYHNILGNADRLEALRDSMAKGWTLAGYLDCGNDVGDGNEAISGRVDFLPVNATHLTRHYIGYYNDTQNRDKPETPLLKEAVLNKPINDVERNAWASILIVEDKKDALFVVKESHKCVNQYGHDTGDFTVSTDGIANTGTSMMPDEILPDRYRTAWASWVIAGKNDEDERELALKRFDRFRYPVDPNRDIYIQANTWGSGSSKNGSREENVLKEIEVQAKLGIDVQQIDDGWQSEPAWRPREDWYPDGWEKVKSSAKEHGVKLGLWAAAIPVPLDALKWNYDHGGFISYKLDFANLNNRDKIESLMDKVRDFVLYTGQKVRVNWDVTENSPRYGYFWARDYGCIYLENRKPEKPEKVVYIPYLVLRDLWQLSKYCNLNKFQGTVQNIDQVNQKASDAYLYNQPYAVAIPLMSTPLFFQETHLYSQQSLNQIKPVLDAYKKVRSDMYACFVYPIGEEPDNQSWAGFQAQHPEKHEGYITLFRELNNHENTKAINLRFLKNKRLHFTNLLTGEKFDLKADDHGYVKFKIEKNADFRFYHYSYQ